MTGRFPKLGSVLQKDLAMNDFTKTHFLRCMKKLRKSPAQFQATMEVLMQSKSNQNPLTIQLTPCNLVDVSPSRESQADKTDTSP